MFLEQQISILQRFLKDHVTPWTGVMAAENSDLQLQEQIKYIKSKQNRKSQFYFDFHHWVLENIRGFFQKH